MYVHHFHELHIHMCLQTSVYVAKGRELKRFADGALLPLGFWTEKANRRAYMDFLKEQLGGTYESLYDVSFSDFEKTGGTSALKYYGTFSPRVAVMQEYAGEFDWKPWKFKRAAKGYWSELGTRFQAGDPQAIEAVSEYIAHLEEKYGLKTIEDWKAQLNVRVPTKDRHNIKHLGGIVCVLSRIRSNQPDKTETEVKPLSTHESIYKYMLHLRDSHGSGSWSAFYNFTIDLFISTGAFSLVFEHHNSIPRMCTAIVPLHYWEQWKFSKTLSNWWTDLGIRFNNGDPVAETAVRMYLEHLESLLGFSSVLDWTGINPSKVLSLRDFRRLQFMGGLPNVLARLFPSIDFKIPSTQQTFIPFRAKAPPASFWKNKENCRKYLDSIKMQLGGTMESLYSLTFPIVIQTGGKGLLSRYSGSPVAAVLDIYSTHKWKPWKFVRCGALYWNQLVRQFAVGEASALEQVADYLEELAEECGVTKLEDWYRVSNSQLGNIHVSRLRSLGGLPVVLQKIYPKHKWNFSLFSTKRFQQSKSAEQRLLSVTIDSLLPDITVSEDVALKENEA